jgi:hypothetical protein
VSARAAPAKIEAQTIFLNERLVFMAVWEEDSDDSSATGSSSCSLGVSNGVHERQVVDQAGIVVDAGTKRALILFHKVWKVSGS